MSSIVHNMDWQVSKRGMQNLFQVVPTSHFSSTYRFVFWGGRGAHLSLSSTYRFLGGAHLSLFINLRVFQGVPTSLFSSTYRFLGGCPPLTFMNYYLLLFLLPMLSLYNQNIKISETKFRSLIHYQGLKFEKFDLEKVRTLI